MLEQLQDLLPDFVIDVEHNYEGDETRSLYTFYKDEKLYQIMTHNDVLFKFGRHAAIEFIVRTIREDEIAYNTEGEL